MRTSVTVASLNIRGVPLTGSRLTARCQAIGALFEASDADVVCFQEVHTYYHLRQLSRQMPSFRYASFRRTLPGPAGDAVTFSRLPVSATARYGFGAPPHVPGIPSLTRIRARMTGALVTRLADPAISVVNTHPVANTDGDWSPANRFTVPSSLLWPVSYAASRSRLWCAGTSMSTATVPCSASSLRARRWTTRSRGAARQRSGPNTSPPGRCRIASISS
jgi:hypothetical protein